MPTNQDVFRDEWYIDISYQLHCFGLDGSFFNDGLVLRSDIPNGIWLRNQLNRIYQEHAPTQRSTIVIKVLEPEFVQGRWCFMLMLEVVVRRGEVTRFYSFPEPFGPVAPPVITPVPVSSAQVPSSAAPASGVPGSSSSGGGGVSGGSGAAGGSSGSGGSGGFGGSGGSGGGEVPGGSGSS